MAIMQRWRERVRVAWRRWRGEPAPPERRKVFCMGLNKTGTTSIGAALHELGYRLGDQAEAELLIEDWARRDFSRILTYCRSADAFQDIPSSLAYTFQAVDAAFPGSKFVLTVRSSAEEWYRSLTAHHSRAFGQGRLPTRGRLEAAEYRRKGYAYYSYSVIYPQHGQMYDRPTFLRFYDDHRRAVTEYFRFRGEDLLVLNVADSDAYSKLCAFLDLPPVRQTFPWLNRAAS